MTLTPFSHTLGPRDAKVVIVGECFGKDDDLVGKPFMGPSGQELTRLLRESGFSRSSCLLTTSHKHTIRLPDSIPDGVRLRVLLLSEAPLAKPVVHNLKAVLASIAEGLTEADTK